MTEPYPMEMWERMSDNTLRYTKITPPQTAYEMTAKRFDPWVFNQVRKIKKALWRLQKRWFLWELGDHAPRYLSGKPTATWIVPPDFIKERKGAADAILADYEEGKS
ncbi:hypothetical protein OAF54_00700 [bacterium]|nr:hypothetical protein [bacterium]